METSKHWLPLTEYALRSGISISTLRRKIKSNTIEFKMEEGRYLIRSDDLADAGRSMGFASSDSVTPRVPTIRPDEARPLISHVTRTEAAPAAPVRQMVASHEEVDRLREQLLRMQEDNLLRWKALEARVAGLAKKLEFFTEQMAETKMLVKIFEEKLDNRG